MYSTYVGVLTNLTSFCFASLPQAQSTSEILVLSGVPIDEPIAARGPFVMNTNQELQQAMTDYRTGRMGSHFESAKR